MEITTDFIEGIIQFADEHKNIGRMDISSAVWNLRDKGVDVSDMEADQIVKTLEVELADEL